MLTIVTFPWWLEWNHTGTPIIAVVATYIALEQYRINRRQYRLALFEKRYSIFNSTATFIAGILQTASVTIPECGQFLRNTRDHEFLFGPEIGAFINEVYKQGVALHTYVSTNNGPKQVESEEWFSGQIENARALFKRYIDFRKP